MSEPQVSWWRTDLGTAEIAAVGLAIQRRCINPGPLCRELEERLADLLAVPYVTTTTSGSMAILMSMLAAEVGRGDEVVLPSAGFIAAAHAALLLGASVKLVDVQADRPLMDVTQLQCVIGPRTKAIVPIYLNGRACDMQSIRAVAAARKIAVIEDCAQAFCSRNSQGCLGTLGNFGAFSMGMTKLVTTGEGGFVATQDEVAHLRLQKLRNHGVLAMRQNVFNELGFNFRFTDLQASVGLAQLREVGAKIAAVKSVYSFYSGKLAGLHYLKLIPVHLNRRELPLWVEVLCSERTKVMALLAKRGIETRAFHPCLADSNHLRCKGEFPNGHYFAEHGLILPSGPDQRPEDLERTVAALWEIADEIESPIMPAPSETAEAVSV